MMYRTPRCISNYNLHSILCVAPYLSHWKVLLAETRAQCRALCAERCMIGIGGGNNVAVNAVNKEAWDVQQKALTDLR